MSRQKGFSLIEVLVALAILAGAIMVLATSWSGNFMRMRKTAMFNDVSTLLERKMAEIEAKYKLKPIAEIPEEEAGEFEGQKNFTWKMKSRDLKFPDLTPLIVGTQENVDETLLTMLKQVGEYLSKAIKEVKVTVVVTRGTKAVEFSAIEYFVDYTQDFMSGVGGAGTSTNTNTGSGTTGSGNRGRSGN